MRLSGLMIATALSVSFRLVSPAYAEDCRADWNAQWAAEAQGYMWVTSGQLCHSEIYTGFGRIDSVDITSPAKYGTAFAKGLSGIDYKSKPGFTGDDRFVVAIEGDSPTGARGVSHIVFHVIVSR